MDEIKLGKGFHYKLDPKSGFWVSQLPTDPMSATITPGELCIILQEHVAYGRSIIAKMTARVDEWEQFIKDNEYAQAKN